MAHKKIQRVRLVVEVYTVAKEPLTIGDYALERLQEGFEQVVQREVDLRYYPESRYVEEYHELTGVTVEEL